MTAQQAVTKIWFISSASNKKDDYEKLRQIEAVLKEIT